MKPKKNYKPGPMDKCQTPKYALPPIVDILHGYQKHPVIWEPAAGEGMMVEGLKDNLLDVVGTELENGQDFFTIDKPHNVDVIVTNPPYSLKYKWVERCFEFDIPWALLLPVESLGAKTMQEMIKGRDFTIILLNKRVNFKMPNKGFEGTAQFPVAWFTHGFGLPVQIRYAEIKP